MEVDNGAQDYMLGCVLNILGSFGRYHNHYCNAKDLILSMYYIIFFDYVNEVLGI